MKHHTIAFTGGGTGGHVFPGIAVAEKLLCDEETTNIHIVWIGSNGGMEKEILGRYNIPFISIPAGKLRRYFSILNFIDIFKIIGGFFAALFFLKKIKADLLFSKGGFVTVPPVFAAKILRIPVISHESDLDSGLATKINGRFSGKMFFAYKETMDSWVKKSPSQEVLVTGNPVRKEIFDGIRSRARTALNIPEDKKVILVLGGSQGAREVNNLVEEIIDDLTNSYFLIHQMGKLSYKKSDRKNYITASLFKEEFSDILAASDLVVSRAGAGTLWENGVLGKPAILIPLGAGSSRGDQVRNADYFENQGAAVVLKGNNVNSTRLFREINKLLDTKSVITELEKNVKLICNTDSAEQIVDIIKQDIGYIK
jgi:UDP-N-acetylglucosamine--N-acetylmuramyl-(pentapeptide) pyrophosphoryl-undecaprenol N-acetylglucosamine transferase